MRTSLLKKFSLSSQRTTFANIFVLITAVVVTLGLTAALQSVAAAIFQTQPVGIEVAGGSLGASDNVIWAYATGGTGSLMKLQSPSGTDRFVVKADGNVGIGTGSPATTLDVNGPVRVGNYASKPSCTASILGALVFDTVNNKPYVCASGSTWKPLDSDGDKDGLVDWIDNNDTSDHLNSCSGGGTGKTQDCFNYAVAAENIKSGVTIFGVEGEAAGSLDDIDVFTSTGIWTRPAGVTEVNVIIIGGGGGGGDAGNGSYEDGGGGGGGGGVVIVTGMSVSASSYAVTVGKGGDGDNGGYSYRNGGESSFNGYTAGGGTGGTGSISGGAGGSPNGADGGDGATASFDVSFNYGANGPNAGSAGAVGPLVDVSSLILAYKPAGAGTGGASGGECSWNSYLGVWQCSASQGGNVAGGGGGGAGGFMFGPATESGDDGKDNINAAARGGKGGKGGRGYGSGGGGAGGNNNHSGTWRYGGDGADGAVIIYW